MKMLFFIAIWLCSAIVFAQQPVDSRQQEVVFRNVNVIPMDRERVLENQVVVAKGGKITALGNEKNVKYSKNALVIDAKGKYLIPGLAEMHAHVPPVDNLEPMKEVLTLFLANGITTIRGMLGHPRHLELREKIRSGEITGPRFYTTGPSFNGNTVQTPAQGEAIVREQKKAGYDYLKLHPGLTRDNFAAIAKTAKEVNIPFVGHVSFDVGVWRAIDAGYSSIDHLDGFVEGMVPGIEQMTEQQTGLFGMFVADKVDLAQMPKLMKGLKEKNIWVVPTQALAERWFASTDPEQLNSVPEMKYMSQEVRENWVESKKNLQANAQYDAAKISNFIQLRRKLISECQKNGVGLLLGCDAPQVFNVPGFSTHHELRYLNKTSDSGTIKIGNVSDLVLLNGNPLTDITQTTQIAGVMIGNLWLPKEYIDGELKKLEKR
jgi:hypothetical protein